MISIIFGVKFELISMLCNVKYNVQCDVHTYTRLQCIAKAPLGDRNVRCVLRNCKRGQHSIKASNFSVAAFFSNFFFCVGLDFNRFYNVCEWNRIFNCVD